MVKKSPTTGRSGFPAPGCFATGGHATELGSGSHLEAATGVEIGDFLLPD